MQFIENNKLEEEKEDTTNIVTLWEGNYYKASGGSIELSDSIDNYSAVIVAAKLYWDSDTTGRQVMTTVIPKQLYYYATKTDPSYKETEFILNNSLGSSNNERRINFGFDPAYPNILYTGVIGGDSGHLPRVIGVYGIK